MALLIFTSSAAAAQDAMTGAEFEAYVAGKTLTFGTLGDPTYGVERYLPGRRVIWSVLDGECLKGVWFESKGNICFRYNGDPEHKCWLMYDEPDGLRAVFTTRPNTTVITEARERQQPLICGDLSS